MLGLSSSVAIAVGIYLHRPRARAAWLFFILGPVPVLRAATSTRTATGSLSGADVGFPSIGDGLYLAVYPALMAGLFLLVRRRNPQRDSAAWIDALILTIGFGLLSWVFLIAPNVHLSGQAVTWFAKSVSVAYPLGDVLLLGAAIRLAVDAGKRAPAFYLLVGSIVCLLATDSAYNLALLKGTYSHDQLIYDVGWIAYYLLWGAAALHPSMRTLEEPAQASRTRLTPLRLALLAGACLIAPCIRFAQQIDNPDVLVLVVASAVLFLLVVSRMAGLVRNEERTATRELALRGAGVELVAAAGRDQVNDAAISAVLALIETPASVRLVLLSGDTAMVAASSDDAKGDWPVLKDASRWLRESAESTLQVSSARLPEVVRTQLRFADGHGALLLPLSVRDETRGLLVVSSPVAIPRKLVDSLESLASQVSLAVEGTSLAEDLHRRQSEARFRSLVAHSSDLITVLDAHGTVTYQSPSVERILGYGVEEIEGHDFARLLSESDRPRLAQILAGVGEAYVGGGSEAHVIECTLKHRDGTWLKFEVQHTDLLQDEHVRGIVLNGRDVSERKAFEDQLAHQAFHDPVTNLANRALFADRVQHAIMRSSRGGPAIGVMFIDLDDFKTVNDSLGHAAGDTVLQEVGTAPRRRRPPGGHRCPLRRRRVRHPARRHRRTRPRPRTSPDACSAPSSSSSRSTASRSTRARASASASPARSSALLMPRSFCATPTSRCTWPSATARAAIASSSRRCTSAWSSGSSCRRSCSRRSSWISSRSTTSPSSASMTASRLRRRGAAALEAPDARDYPAPQLHPARRGDRPDRPDRPLGPAAGLPRRASACTSGSRGRRR